MQPKLRLRLRLRLCLNPHSTCLPFHIIFIRPSPLPNKENSPSILMWPTSVPSCACACGWRPTLLIMDMTRSTRSVGALRWKSLTMTPVRLLTLRTASGMFFTTCAPLGLKAKELSEGTRDQRHFQLWQILRLQDPGTGALSFCSSLVVLNVSGYLRVGISIDTRLALECART